MITNRLKLDLPGRILFLSNAPALIESQLAGRDLTVDEAGPLRDDISTDEITPVRACVYYDERLGRFPYIGLKAGDRRPIGIDKIIKGGFSVVVAGKRYGKGSSREHSPAAERAAGVRLVIAESFERIYRQNADNLGLYTSTDLGLVARVQRGEAIYLDEILAGRDALAVAILQSGGLLRYTREKMEMLQADQGAVGSGRPQTLVEKIIARHALRTAATGVDLTPGAGLFVRAEWRFIHEYYTGMCSHMLHEAFGRPAPLVDKPTILAFEDHLSYSRRSPAHASAEMTAGVRDLSEAHRAFVGLYGLKDHGYLPSGEGSEGICHALMAERYALPGEVVVGTDSHTTHSGALGCFAFGVGTTDMASAMISGAVRLSVPETVRIELKGAIAKGVTAKDIVLHLLALPRLRSGGGIGKVFEFAGPAIAALSIDERTTLTNMTAELGGLTGIVEPDAETVRFLRERRSIDFELQPWMKSDAGARYVETISVDCTTLAAVVASPGDPGNGVALATLGRRPKIDIAYGGSCTAGKREDFDRYHEVLSWAANRGLTVKAGVKLYLQFGTTAVRDYCEARGYLETFRRVGAELLEPACGACANCGPGSSERPDQVTVSAINRNFPGRSGPGQVWLASPPTVAASAVLGELASFGELMAQGEARHL